MRTILTRTLLLAGSFFALTPGGFGKPLAPVAPRPANAVAHFAWPLGSPAGLISLPPLAPGSAAGRPVVAMRLAQCLDVAGPVTEQWVARFDTPPGARAASTDLARAVAVDAAGNVYVTGSSAISGAGFSVQSDYLTIKYSPTGQQLWTARFNGPANGYDDAQALAVDGAGNVYVTGTSAGPGGDDYATIKYSPDGQQLWVQRYRGPAYRGDEAQLALDAAGNVYVAGTSVTTVAGVVGYAVLKYSADGQQQWLARYDRPGNSGSFVKALAVDAAGNAYVTGLSYGDNSSTGADYATVKFSASGQLLWEALYNGSANGYDEARDVAVDAAGSVYVTGTSAQVGTGSDYATLKYSASGQPLWAALYNGPASGADGAQALALDAAGEVYVTGTSAGGASGNDYATLKYSTGGQQLWESRYNGPGSGRDEARDLAVDAAGNAYVTGLSAGRPTPAFSTESDTYDYATIKYSAGGQQLWEARYNGPANSQDEAQALTLDAAANVYVTGYSTASSPTSFGLDYATIKYAQTPAGNSLPQLTAPGPISVAAEPGQCGASVPFAATATGEPAPTITYATAAGPITSPHVFAVGITTVTATATNGGGSQSSTFTVTVADREAPVARTKPATVYLGNDGQAVIAGSDVDGGSTDNCAIVSRTVSPGRFTCANLGPNTVTLTVTDAQGNASSATAVVTVLGGAATAAAITVVPANAVYTGGVATNLYLGYGPPSVTLQATVGGARYAWSGPAGLSDPTSAAPVFTATAAGQFTYTVIITNEFGCPSTATVTLTVRDVRCGNGEDKVVVCHKGKEICISADAVETHLTHHQDQLGSCATGHDGKDKDKNKDKLLAANEELAPALEAYPNPFTTATTLRFRAAQAGPAQLRVYNALGQVVATLFDQPAQAGRQYEVVLAGNGLAHGLYTCRLVVAGKSYTQRVLLTE